MNRSVALALLLLSSAAMPAASYADMGTVGSPVKASNATTQTPGEPNANLGNIGPLVQPSNVPKGENQPPAGMGGVSATGAVANPYVKPAPAPVAAEETVPVPSADSTQAAAPEPIPTMATGTADTAAQTATEVNPSSMNLPTKPLMVIRFNQNHVYYGRTLDQAVGSAEQTKPNMTYYVVSYVPQGGGASQNNHISDTVKGNVGGVLEELEAQGVPAARIVTMTKPAPDNTHRVELYVQ